MINEAQLSNRELEILELVATGISNKEIAVELGISQNTVKVHLRNIFNKLGVSTRTEAALTAIQSNLVEFNGIGPDDLLPSDPSSRRIQVFPSENRVNGWTLSLALVGILLLGLVGMLILLRQDESRVDEISTIAPDVESNRWKELAGLPTARNGLALVTYENLIFAIGGENVDGVTGAAERYNPIDDTWIQLTQKPTPVTDVMGAVVGGKVYIPGGRLPSGELTDKFEVYNPIEDIWEQKASMPHPVAGYSLVSFEGKVFLFGGWDGHDYLSTVYVYDPQTDEWQEQSPMPTARVHSGAAIAGGVIYVVGGINGEGILAVNESYFPERDLDGGEPWISKVPMPYGRSDMGVIGLADIVYVIGGNSSDDRSDFPLHFIPNTDSWGKIESSQVPAAWRQFGLVSLEGQLYMIGGISQGKILSTNLSFQALYTVLIPGLLK